MSRFTEIEQAYLKTQKAGRLATVNKHGEPQNAPVTFRYNEELDTIDIGGPRNGESQKYRNVARNGLASFVVDDFTEWGGRGIEIRAHAEAVSEGGGETIYTDGEKISKAGETVYSGFSPEVIRLTPKRIIAWDLSNGIPFSKRNVE